MKIEKIEQNDEAVFRITIGAKQLLNVVEAAFCGALNPSARPVVSMVIGKALLKGDGLEEFMQENGSRLMNKEGEDGLTGFLFQTMRALAVSEYSKTVLPQGWKMLDLASCMTPDEGKEMLDIVRRHREDTSAMQKALQSFLERFKDKLLEQGADYKFASWAIVNSFVTGAMDEVLDQSGHK